MAEASFSTVIPAFNSAATLTRTVQSAQAAGADVIIVVDDGSTDHTATLAKNLGCTVVSQVNSGAAAARRRGLREVASDFVIMLDADDSLIQLGVQRSLVLLQGDSDVVAAQGVVVGVGRNGTQRNFRQWPEGVTTSSLLARGHAPAPPAAYVWRTEALNAAMKVNDGLWTRYAEDYELLIRVSELGTISLHSEPACFYNWIGGKSATNPVASINDAERIRAFYAARHGLHESLPTRRHLRSLVFTRRASALTEWWQAPARLLLYGTAAAMSPRRAAARLKRTFRSR